MLVLQAHQLSCLARLAGIGRRSPERRSDLRTVWLGHPRGLFGLRELKPLTGHWNPVSTFPACLTRFKPFREALSMGATP